MSEEYLIQSPQRKARQIFENLVHDIKASNRFVMTFQMQEAAGVLLASTDVLQAAASNWSFDFDFGVRDACSLLFTVYGGADIPFVQSSVLQTDPTAYIEELE